MQRIGVFVCHCGTNIAGTVDVKAVAAALGNEPGVVVAEDYQYMCSQAGQDLIKKQSAKIILTEWLSAHVHRACTRQPSAKQPPLRV